MKASLKVILVHSTWIAALALVYYEKICIGISLNWYEGCNSEALRRNHL